MTTRELRQMLSAVENQNLTVKELREILFEVEEQDEKLEDYTLRRMTL